VEKKNENENEDENKKKKHYVRNTCVWL